MQKSECLSLAGILANFAGDLPSFLDTCLITSTNDDKLLPQDSQPSFYTSDGFIAITFKQQTAIKEDEYVV
jgi:hypothetical protein